MKVDFLVIGAMKSATTGICNGLSQHPEICFSEPKEPNFFCHLDWRDKINSYHNLFTSKAKLYGEGSTNYSKFPYYNKNIHKDIYEYNPNMKIIYVLRHPIERMVSQYTHQFNRGFETKEINIAMSTDEHYTNDSKYATQIRPYIELFGRDNIKFIFFDDYKNNPQSVFNELFNFLSIKIFNVKLKKLNKNSSYSIRMMNHKYDSSKNIFSKLRKGILIFLRSLGFNKPQKKPTINSENKARLIEIFKEEISKIETLTNRDLSHWLN